MTLPKLSFSTPCGPAGAPLLLLSSVVGTARGLWADASAQLSQQFQVAHWDLPGHGSSPAAAAPFTMGEVADAVAARIDDYDDVPILYAGASMGGAVGLELLLRHPGRVSAAAILCSGAKIGTSEIWHARAGQVRAQGTGSLASVSAERWFAPGSLARFPRAGATLLAELRNTDDESYALCCEALADYDVHRSLKDITIPVLAVSGEHDFLTPEENSDVIAKGVQNGRCAVVADAAHVAPAEQSVVVAALLAEFFGSVDST